jgi:hypothetical protein
VQPDGFGSITNTFSYKNVELSIMLYYQYGFQIYYPNPEIADGYLPYANQSKSALDYWKKPDIESQNPKPILNNSNNVNTNRSTRYLVNGDYIRLHNISLGYQFPTSLVNRLHLSGLRVFVQGNNLAVWSPAESDPANTSFYGVVDYAYPMQRTYSIGINVDF